eukprot:9252886-Lingulodinium_polyedra.AAC.1
MEVDARRSGGRDGQAEVDACRSRGGERQTEVEARGGAGGGSDGQTEARVRLSSCAMLALPWPACRAMRLNS